MSDELAEFYSNVGTSTSKRQKMPSRGGQVYAENAGKIVSADPAVGESRWSEADGLFWRASRTHALIPSGLYNCLIVDGIGPALRKQELKTDDLLILPEPNSAEILKEFEHFWTLEDRFKEFGFLYKRGFLLWGPPGSGKTSLINLMMKTIIQKYNGIIIIVEDPDYASACLSMIRKNEPERPLITILEDLDALVERWGEASYLALLDGSEQINNVIHVGTCFSPEVRFLTTDLRWVPCGELKLGDELWAFDEDQPKDNQRRFRRSLVTRSHRAVKECVRITLNTGETFVCTTDHPWLAYQNVNEHPTLPLDWVLAEHAQGVGLVRPFTPRAEQPIAGVELSGGMMHNKFPSRVVAVEPVGMQEIQSIETSTHTYIAEGFACHNTNYPEKLDKRFVDRPSRFDTVVKIGMPGWEARHEYFRTKMATKKLDWWSEEEHNRWTRMSEGFSVAHMREMIIAVCGLGKDVEEVVSRLSKMHKRQPSSTRDPDGPAVGFAFHK